MLLAYLDESYDEKRYWIVAVVCPDSEVRPLTEELDEVVRRSARTFPGLNAFGELHGHALFHGKDDWAAVATMPRARIGIYGQALSVIAQHDVRIIIRGVDCIGLSDRYSSPEPPHALVLMHLLERINDHAIDPENNVIVIADEVPEANAHRRSLWNFQRNATWGYRSQQLTRIIDTIHFAPSTSSRLLQAADIVAFLWYRMDAGTDKDARAIKANNDLWNLMSGKVIHNWIWTP